MGKLGSIRAVAGSRLLVASFGARTSLSRICMRIIP